MVQQRIISILQGIKSPRILSQAIKLMTDAATDPKLYAALLTGPTTAVRKQREAAQHLEAWLLGQAAQQAEQVLGEDSM